MIELVKLNYSRYCNRKLFAYFPELLLRDLGFTKIIQRAYEVGKECKLKWPDTGDTSAHGIYGDVFCPYVFDLMKKNDQESQAKIKKAFVLLEEIASHEDYYIRNVAEVSFIEKFTADIEPMKDVEKYLLPNSLEMAREIAQKWFGRNPRTWEEKTTANAKLVKVKHRLNKRKK